MARKRKYDDGCAVAQALDIVGERWAMLIIRELLLGPKRFTDLLAGLPGVSPDVLTQRLRELADAGLLQRRRLGPPAATWVYELTPAGAGLESVIIGLARWVHESGRMRYDLPLGSDSLMLSLKTLFNPEAAEGFRAVAQLNIDDEQFVVRVEDRRLGIERGVSTGADITFDGNVGDLLGLLQGQVPSSGAVTGTPEVAERFLRLFPV